MSRYPSEFITATCRITERIAPTAYRATLPNGKPTVAFLQRKEAHLIELINIGDEVLVSIATADFDRARIRQILS